MNKIIAIIPARGGSKGLPRKNVLDLNGKPLIAHTIEAALKSNIFSKIVVTTDDKEIREVALKYGADVIDRPKELATDGASSLDVIKHTLLTLQINEEKYSHFILLQPTSPLRNENHINEAWNKYTTEEVSSLVSVTAVVHPPQKMLILDNNNSVKPLTQWEDLTKPRQQLPKAFLPNGAIYISEVDKFLEKKNLFVIPLSLYIMTVEDSVDIDTKEDLEKLERLVKWQ